MSGTLQRPWRLDPVIKRAMYIRKNLPRQEPSKRAPSTIL